MSKKKNFTKVLTLQDLKRKNRTLRLLYIVLDILVAITLLRSIFRAEYSNVFVCVLTLALFTLPTTVEKSFKLKLPTTFEGLVLIFIFSAEIMGEINCYYQRIANWDTVLHTINGFMFAAFGFALLDIINRKPQIKFNLSPIYFALVAFCFSMTIGVLWEFFEFGSDMLVHTDMQKDTYIKGVYTVILDDGPTNTVIPIENIEKVVIYRNGNEPITLDAYIDIGLIDTMKDLFVNFLGAVCFSVIGFFYLKQRGKGKIASQFIPTIVETSDSSTDALSSEKEKAPNDRGNVEGQKR